jgi:PPE-repeat protein
MDFAGLPPEINSTRMYSGPGSGPLLAASAAWDGLAAELNSAATACESVISQLAGEAWLGPSSAAMAAAVTPYVSWLSATAGQAEQTATQAKAAAAAYGGAFAMTVPPSVVMANRAQLQMLVATNVLGQNTAAIAATEAHYAEMWAQDAAAMGGYAASSAQAAELSPFAPPPQTTNPAGPSQQAAAAGHDAGSSAGQAAQQALSQLSSATANAATPLPAQDLGGLAGLLGLVPDLVATLLPDVLGLSAVGVVGAAASGVGVGVSAGAWHSADESTQQILIEQEQLRIVGLDILHNIDVFSPLTPSRPEGFVPVYPPAYPPAYPASTSAATGEAVSVGKLSVPMSWAANAPEVRSLAYTAPTAAAGAAPAATGAPQAAVGGAGTAFSQMALAGMGGSALAGTVKPGRQGAIATSTPREPTKPTQKPAQEPPDEPVTGIAAEIRAFGELRDRGLITKEEYDEQKQRLLGR